MLRKTFTQFIIDDYRWKRRGRTTLFSIDVIHRYGALAFAIKGGLKRDNSCILHCSAQIFHDASYS